MVQAVVKLSEKTNRVINIVKAKHGLKDKSQAIEMITNAYEEQMLEPELRPEFVEEVRKIESGKFHKYNSIDDLKRDIDNAWIWNKRRTQKAN